MSAAEEILSSPPDEFHLACLLLSPTGVAYLGETLENLSPEDFADPTLAWMWAAARVIHTRGERVTRRTLLALRDVVAPPKVPGQPAPAVVPVPGLPFNAPAGPTLRARLDHLAGEPVFTGRLAASVRTVQEVAKLRRLVRALEEARSHAVVAEDYSRALGACHELLGRLDDGEIPAEVVAFADLVDDFYKWQAGGLDVGQVIPTPWPELNDLMSGGFHPGRSAVVAGRPGAGKSNVGLNCAQFAAEQGFPTLVVSEEMSGLEVTGRLMAAGARVEYSEITRYSMSAETHAAVTEYGETNRDMPLWVLDKPDLTIEYVAAVARAMKRRQGLDFLVIDYLQLLAATDKRVSREQQVAHISKSIKNLSRDLKCSIVILAQLNRDNVKSNRRPTVADLRESGSIEQDCDTAILLHHELDDDDQPTGMVTLILDKSRFGKKADVQLRWRGHQARIGD